MSQSNVQSLNILIADDEPEIAATIVHVLKRAGHHADIVCDGAEALARIEAAPGHYHILITDSNMPGLSGIKLIRKLRAAGNPCRIIFLYGDIDDEIEEECAALRVEKIMHKPAPLAEICRQVELLGGKAGAGAPK